MSRITLIQSDTDIKKIKIISDSYIIPLVAGVTKKSFIQGRNKVNLHYLTCSCKVYRANVKIYPRRDIRRVCKHLYSKLIAEIIDYLDPLTIQLLHNQFWFGQFNTKKISYNGDILIIGQLRDKRFANVFTESSNWTKYVFSLELNTWVDNLRPFRLPETNNNLEEFLKVFTSAKNDNIYL